jgi:hypothetical protein
MREFLTRAISRALQAYRPPRLHHPEAPPVAPAKAGANFHIVLLPVQGPTAAAGIAVFRPICRPYNRSCLPSPLPPPAAGVGRGGDLGTNFVVIKLAFAHLPPLLFAALRFTFACLPMVFFLPRPKASWGNIAAYGLLIGVGQFGLMFIAMNGQISPGLASLVIQTQVFFTIFLAMRMTRERLRPVQWAALAMATAGIAIIASHTDGSTTVGGLLIMLVAAACWAGGNMVNRQAGKVNMVAYVVWSSLFAAPPLFVFAAVRRLAGHRAGFAQRRHCDLGRGAVAIGRQFAVRLCRVGLADRALSSGHGDADGAAGAGVRHGGIESISRRGDARLEADRDGAGDGRIGDQSLAAGGVGDGGLWRDLPFTRSRGYIRSVRIAVAWVPDHRAGPDFLTRVDHGGTLRSAGFARFAGWGSDHWKTPTSRDCL